MLAIRLQRTGRKGHAQFRVLVQDARRTPTSGRFVAMLGSYNPHTKAIVLDKEKAEFYLKNGARPSDRAAYLLQTEGIKLPDWVKVASKKQGATRNPEKLRKNQPKEEAPVEAPASEAATEESTPAESTDVSTEA